MHRFFASAAVALSLALPAAALEVPPLGDDGLHKPDWLRDTFKDLREDLAEANAEGKRLLVIVEQRGCIYCTKMHEKIFPEPEIDALIRDNYFVVQMNLFGDVEVTDFDGESLPEKDMAVKWGVVFTPTMIFLPEEVAEGQDRRAGRRRVDAGRIRQADHGGDVDLGEGPRLRIGRALPEISRRAGDGRHVELNSASERRRRRRCIHIFTQLNFMLHRDAALRYVWIRERTGRTSMKRLLCWACCCPQSRFRRPRPKPHRPP